MAPSFPIISTTEVIYVVSSETESAFKWFRTSCNNARLMELMDLTRLVEYL